MVWEEGGNDVGPMLIMTEVDYMYVGFTMSSYPFCIPLNSSIIIR